MTTEELQELEEALTRALDLRAQLDTASDEMNAGIQRIELAIRRLRFGVTARAPIFEGHWLAWGKLDGEWRLQHLQGEEITEPLINSSRTTRMLAVSQIRALLLQLAEGVEIELGKVRQRVGDLERLETDLGRLAPKT